MAEDIPLASLSLTHVYYDPSDPVSYLCAWLALVPQALCIVYATLIWSTREAEVVLMFAGQLACEAVNFALKRIIKEERPSRIHRTGKGYGMPSSHAQFVAFWAVAMTLFLLVRHTPSWTAHGYGPKRTTTTTPTTSTSGGGGSNSGTTMTTAITTREQQGKKATTTTGSQDSRTNNSSSSSSNGRRSRSRHSSWGQDWVMVETYAHRPWSLLERSLVSLLVLVVAAAVAWSRVYLGYHTVNQVLAGSLAGTLSAAAWYGVTAVVRETGLLAWALASPVARGLRVRDLVVSEDLAQAGWEKWEDRKGGAGGDEDDDEDNNEEGATTATARVALSAKKNK